MNDTWEEFTPRDDHRENDQKPQADAELWRTLAFDAWWRENMPHGSRKETDFGVYIRAAFYSGLRVGEDHELGR